METKKYLSVMIRTMLVSVGLTLVDYGAGIAPAVAAPPVKDDPHAGLTKNWDRNLPSASRFTVLTEFSSAAVRDNNTGLVWEQAPEFTTMAWPSAIFYCLRKNVGGTVGWRFPSVVELKSVLDPTLPGPFVPTSVFTGVQTFVYWSASTTAASPTSAWSVLFNDGDVNTFAKGLTAHVWCMRGPMQESVY